MPPMQAAVEATQRDRPGGAGDDAVAGRDLRAGRLHGRHRRPLHDELRPDDGVRDHGVAARQLHADADDVGALAQGEAAHEDEGHGHDSKDSRLFAPLDRVLHAACSSGRWRTAGIVAGVAVLVLLSSVPLFMVANKNFTAARTISREFEVSAARAGGHQPRGDRGASPTASRTRDPRSMPEVELHAGHGGRRPGAARGTSPTVYVRLKPIEERDARSVRDDGRGAQRRSCRRSRGRTCAPRVQPVGGDRRRRRPERRHPVRDQRARPRSSSSSTASSCVDAGQDDARRGRRRHDAERRQAGAVGASSIGRRRPTSACRSPTPPRRCACWSAATR